MQQDDTSKRLTQHQYFPKSRSDNRNQLTTNPFPPPHPLPLHPRPRLANPHLHNTIVHRRLLSISIHATAPQRRRNQTFLPTRNTSFPMTSPNDVSALLTSRWIWEALAPAEHILIFGRDTILCGNAPRSVDDFLEWDFIGSPIADGSLRGFNGGLSLRKRSSMMRVLERFDYPTNPTSGVVEGQWYYER